MAEAGRFLAAISPDEMEFTFQTFDDNKVRKDKSLARILHGTFAQHADTLRKLNDRGAGVFVTINRTDGKGRSAANIVAVRALFVDLDGSPLEPVLAADVPPNIVVESSEGRWHAYWLIRDVSLDKFKLIQQALIARFKSDESVCDLPRVLRLPGFWHCKAAPFKTRILCVEGVGDDLI